MVAFCCMCVTWVKEILSSPFSSRLAWEQATFLNTGYWGSPLGEVAGCCVDCQPHSSAKVKGE